MKRLIVLISAVVMLFGFVGAASAYSDFSDVKDWGPGNKWVFQGTSYSWTHDLSSLTDPIVDATYDLDFTNVDGWHYQATVDVSFDGGATWFTDLVVEKGADHLIFDLADYIGAMTTSKELMVTVRVTDVQGVGWPYAYVQAQTVSGHTNPVPIPGAAWLLGSGLVGLVGLRRRKKKV